MIRETGRKDWVCEGLGKGDPSCQMAQAVTETSRKEEVSWKVGAVADRRRSEEMLERKVKLLVWGRGAWGEVVAGSDL